MDEGSDVFNSAFLRLAVATFCVALDNNKGVMLGN